MPANTPICLIDLNAAFVSMEVLFRPWLKGFPCAVLSNNDGCCVARNAECKALGIKMGQPFHEVKHLVESGQLKVFSACFPLYQSISDRAHDIVSMAASRTFQYSIDEWFLDATGAGDDLEGWGTSLREELLRKIGIPSGVGIGPTKTLAKLANYGAKNWAPKTGWVVNLMDPVRQQKLLALTDVDEVWGIGGRLAKRLRQDANITTAKGLAEANKRWLRRQYGVVVERTARELCGEPCLAFDESLGIKKRIAATRAFGERVTDLGNLRSALSTHASTVAEKCRRQGSLAQVMVVFAQTSPFGSAPFHRDQHVIELPRPTADTRELAGLASQAADRFFRPNRAYAKCGVILHQLVEKHGQTPDLFAPAEPPRSEALMRAMDAINTKMGRGTVRVGQSEQGHSWRMRQQFLSPRYTTRWQDLPVCR